MEEKVQPASVKGDRELLARLAGNLLENAVRYNVAGGSVEVETRVEGDRAILRVTNTGPLMAPSEVGVLFEPFRRGGKERTGSAKGAGLGLSIVRSIATAHGGMVEATARPEGGLTVMVSLPLESTQGDRVS